MKLTQLNSGTICFLNNSSKELVIKFSLPNFIEPQFIIVRETIILAALNKAAKIIVEQHKCKFDEIDFLAVLDKAGSILWLDSSFPVPEDYSRRQALQRIGLLAGATFFNFFIPQKIFAATKYSSSVNFSGKTQGLPVYGNDAVYTSPGSYTFTVPAGVTSISVLCIGGGGSGVSGANNNGGGGGGALAYISSMSVTPGQTYPLVVGNSGQASTFNTTLVAGGGGNGGNGVGGAGGTPSGPAGFIGYSGGAGGTGGTGGVLGGGGGAAGYTSNGGAGGNLATNAGTSSTSGGGGGGGHTFSGANNYFPAGAGGGVGIQGTKNGIVAGNGGAANGGNGTGGTGGTNASSGGGGGSYSDGYSYGGSYGGGTSGRGSNSVYLTPGTGAVRIIWGVQTFNEEAIYKTAGTYNFTVPAGVTSISVLCVGGGGRGGHGSGVNGGGGGGALVYLNNITVTPGNSYPVVVGRGADATNLATASTFDGTLIAGAGGNGGTNVGGAGGTPSGPAGFVGYSGGAGGTGSPTALGGGGGAAGYTSDGGAGGNLASDSGASSASGGGGGGGFSTNNSNAAGAGGGVGTVGTGPGGTGGLGNNVSSLRNGSGGSYGVNGSSAPSGCYSPPSSYGGNYGGGGGAGFYGPGTSFGASGFVFIIWGGKVFPNG
jgi:hypothetical protein